MECGGGHVSVGYWCCQCCGTPVFESAKKQHEMNAWIRLQTPKACFFMHNLLNGEMFVNAILIFVLSCKYCLINFYTN